MAAITLALLIALGVVARISGKRIYETGPTLETGREGETVILTWRGPVEAPMAARFGEALADSRDAPRILVRLDSQGGSLSEGRLVIREIEKAKAHMIVDTYVASGDICLSMCVPIYLAGSQRSAGARARFMFHEPKAFDTITGEPSQQPRFEQSLASDWFFEAYFGASPMNPEWREALRAKWKGRELWYTARQLVEEDSGIVEAIE